MQQSCYHLFSKTENNVVMVFVRTFFELSWERLIGAASTIFLTTLEDAVWLIPFCLHASNNTIGFCHAIIFVITFTCLSATIGLITILTLDAATAAAIASGAGASATADNSEESLSFYCGLVGAVLCWLFFGFFYYKSWKKTQRKLQRRSQEKESVSPCEVSNIAGSDAATVSNDYGAMESQPMLSTSATNNVTDNVNSNGLLNESAVTNDDESNKINSIQLWTVITLTILGALDEVAYFPSVILGHVFTIPELIIGTIIASSGILIVVYCFLAPCKPVLRVLDKIPIYGVVGVFAVLLTIGVISDLV